MNPGMVARLGGSKSSPLGKRSVWSAGQGAAGPASSDHEVALGRAVVDPCRLSLICDLMIPLKIFFALS